MESNTVPAPTSAQACVACPVNHRERPPDATPADVFACGMAFGQIGSAELLCDLHARIYASSLKGIGVPEGFAYARLHRALDELLAQFLMAHPDARPSTTSALELCEWNWARLESANEPDGTERERRTLQWLEGPQAFHDSPDSRDLGAVRESGLARDEGGRIVLTDAGRSRLEELERARTERAT